MGCFWAMGEDGKGKIGVVGVNLKSLNNRDSIKNIVFYTISSYTLIWWISDDEKKFR